MTNPDDHTSSRRRPAILTGIGILVLSSGVVVAVADAGAPLPAALVLGALLVCVLTVIAVGVFGYRESRREGRGVVRSIGSGFRWAGRAIFDLF